MKKGLVSPAQIAYESIGDVQGTAMGPYIVEVEDPLDIFSVDLPFFWVDVPDTATGYNWFYDLDTFAAVEIARVEEFAYEEVPAYNLNIGDGILVVTPIGETVYIPGTTTDVPPVPPLGSTLYWWETGTPSSQWVTSYFDPNKFSTLAAAQTHLYNVEVLVYGVFSQDNQLRNYNIHQLKDAPSVLTLDCVDYPIAWGTYAEYIRTEMLAQKSIIDSALTIEELFPYNPRGWSTVYP